MKASFLAAAMAAAMLFASPVAIAANAQQDKMTECNAKAAGMKGDARGAFMKECLAAKPAAAPAKQCKTGKPCGNSCIAMNKVCHKP